MSIARVLILILSISYALRLAGVEDAKIVNYVQFAYEILKVNDNKALLT